MVFGNGHEEIIVDWNIFIDEKGVEIVEIFIEPGEYLKSMVEEAMIDPRTSTLRLTFPKFHCMFLCNFSGYSRILVLTSWDKRHTLFSLKHSPLHEKILGLQRQMFSLDKGIAHLRHQIDQLQSEPHSQVEKDVDLFLEILKTRRRKPEETEGEENEADVGQ